MNNPIIGNIYNVELQRWNISNNGTNPASTIKGINEMLAWAKNAGYHAVYLDAGTYSLDMNVLTPIQVWQADGKQRIESGIVLQNGLSFYMHSDTILKVAPNNLPLYRVINVAGVKNLSIVGGRIVGDRYEHDYGAKTYFEFGDLDASGKPTISSSSVLRSKSFLQYYSNGQQIPLNIQLYKLDGIVTGSEADFKCDVLCYDAKDVLLQRFVNVPWYAKKITSPPNTVKWKLVIKQSQCYANTSAFIVQDKIYPTHEFGFGICLRNTENIVIRNMRIEKLTGDGIAPIDTQADSPGVYRGNTRLRIEDCTIDDCRRQGISIVEGDNIYISRCTISNIKGADPQFGIDIESSGGLGDNIFIEDCSFINNAKGDIVSYDGTGLYIKGCQFSGLVGSTFGYNIDIQDSVFHDPTGTRTALQYSYDVMDKPGTFFRVRNCKFSGFQKVGSINNCDQIEFIGNKIYNMSDKSVYGLTLTLGRCHTLIARDNVYENAAQLFYFSSSGAAAQGAITSETYVGMGKVYLNDSCLISQINAQRTTITGKGDLILHSCAIQTGNGTSFIQPFANNVYLNSLTMLGGSVRGSALNRSSGFINIQKPTNLKGVNIQVGTSKVFVVYAPLELTDCDIEINEDPFFKGAWADVFSASNGSTLLIRCSKFKYNGPSTVTSRYFFAGASYCHLLNNIFEVTASPLPQISLPANSTESGTTFLVNGTVTAPQGNIRKAAAN